MKCLAAAVLALAAASACSSTPAQRATGSLAEQMRRSPDRFIIAAVVNTGTAPQQRAGSTPRGYDAIAAYRPSPRAAQLMRSLESQYALREVNAWPIQALHMHCAVLAIPEGADRGSLLAALAHDPRIRLAQPMQTFATRTEVYNDPYVDLQRGFRQMDVADAHPWSRGEGVRVAIIDTGADTDHPDLRGNVAAAANFVDADAVQFRRDRHGTEMAGLIAAAANNHRGIVGIAPNAHLLIYKACWQSQADADAALCNSLTLARALAAALDAHAQVVNLSVAGPEDALLHVLIAAVLEGGILFVGAAPAAPSGGEARLLQQSGVIEVASSESRAGAAGALYAPGREILTLLPGGRYDFASGDSIATAQVTGVIALLLAKNPALSAAAAYRLLRDTSSHSLGVASGGVGGTRVDACAAVVAVVGRGSCAADTGALAAAASDGIVSNKSE
jgi:hypothetical protein